MTLTIDATVGGSAANSFVTETEQIAYMAARLNSTAWTTFSGSSCTETEKAAMIEAARELCYLYYIGLPVLTVGNPSGQALPWPRQYAPNPDSAWPGLLWYDVTEIPQRIKNAQMELAFQFLNLGTTDLAAYDSTLNIKSKTVDVLQTVYQDVYNRPTGLARFPRVMRELSPLLDPSQTSSSVPLIRG